jgi:hypothetical protein
MKNTKSRNFCCPPEAEKALLFFAMGIRMPDDLFGKGTTESGIYGWGEGYGPSQFD